jgi:hypothetical protein
LNRFVAHHCRESTTAQTCGSLSLCRAWALIAAANLIFPLLASSAESPQLDSITVRAKKEREQLEHDIHRFVTSAMARRSGESFKRWNTPVCPLVAGLPRDRGEFVLARVSQAARNARVALAPEDCKANFLVLVSSDPVALLRDLENKKPGLFDIPEGMGYLKHFLETDRPVRVWYNWDFEGEGSALATAASISGTGAPSAATTGYKTARLPNSRLSYSGFKAINTAIIAVDLPRMNGVNMAQLADYVAMVGLAEITLDGEIGTMPSVLRLFSGTGGAPTEGMSSWDQALLKALYASRSTSVVQASSMETQMLDSIERH